MVLVRDKKGHLFGGYAAEGWSKHGQFYGSALSFIFSVSPAVARFRASRRQRQHAVVRAGLLAAAQRHWLGRQGQHLILMQMRGLQILIQH